ncbi:MAG: hypothetical protein J5828_01860, partial [Desulfovibrionaceae bacterium]|nr:hypothetical protein [Desulfovibrionaceae bacterium]
GRQKSLFTLRLDKTLVTLNIFAYDGDGRSRKVPYAGMADLTGEEKLWADSDRYLAENVALDASPAAGQAAGAAQPQASPAADGGQDAGGGVPGSSGTPGQESASSRVMGAISSLGKAFGQVFFGKEDGSWTCACGAVNNGNYCQECGAKKPQCRCSRCGWEPKDQSKPPKFCPQCGNKLDGGSAG